MSNRPVLDSRYAAGAAVDTSRYLEDYPLQLLTRRTLGLNAERITAERQNAPCQVGCLGQASPGHRPPS